MNNKLIIFTLTILFSVILTLSILFFSQIDDIEKPLEKRILRHPCQKAVLDDLALYKDYSNLFMFPNLSKEKLVNSQDEFYKRHQQVQQSVIDNNCKDTKHEWSTKEFEIYYRMLLEGGF